jgi:replicative DNA helicase
MIEGNGPAKGEILCWMAPTGVGKSILLPHSGIACLKRGCNVLHITCELSIAKTALRYAGAISNVEIHKRFEAQQRSKMLQALERVKSTYKGDLKIFEFPPDEISVDQIYHLITQLRRQWNWHPDVVVIDYLELMISRRDSDNVNDYTKQKQVATQLRGLARNEEVLVFTATQTNRQDPRSKGGPAGGLIGLNRVAESYGKMKPMDYVLSANQEMEEYNSDNPQLRLFFAKNRNGQKNKVVPVSINYKTFRMAEITTNKITKK